MAALTGAWKAQRQGGAMYSDYVGALKWGTGINPIHGIRGGEGRNIAPGEQTLTVVPDLTESYQHDDTAYPPEDSASTLWGYGVDTGTADRPGWGGPDQRADAGNFPSWGQSPSGIPLGTRIRSILKGAAATVTMKQTPNETVSEGWLNKAKSTVEDAVVSDPSQYEMQTSMTQRDKVRAGSQMPMGRENEYDAPIASRIPAMKEKVYSGGERHYDMEPKAQDVIIRPFWARTAGTGYRQWMTPNEMYVSNPLDRTVPDNPNAGPETPPTGSEYGFMDEDMSYYG